MADPITLGLAFAAGGIVAGLFGGDKSKPPVVSVQNLMAATINSVLNETQLSDTKKFVQDVTAKSDFQTTVAGSLSCGGDLNISSKTNVKIYNLKQFSDTFDADFQTKLSSNISSIQKSNNEQDKDVLSGLTDILNRNAAAGISTTQNINTEITNLVKNKFSFKKYLSSSSVISTKSTGEIYVKPGGSIDIKGNCDFLADDELAYQCITIAQNMTSLMGITKSDATQNLAQSETSKLIQEACPCLNGTNGIIYGVIILVLLIGGAVVGFILFKKMSGNKGMGMGEERGEMGEEREGRRGGGIMRFVEENPEIMLA